MAALILRQIHPWKSYFDIRANCIEVIKPAPKMFCRQLAESFCKTCTNQPEYFNLNLEQQPSLIKFCRNLAIKGTKLIKRSKLYFTIDVTFSSYSRNIQSPTYNIMCKYSLIKYSSWSFKYLEEMDNEDGAEER